MNIFENLENLNVSEECFEDIMSIVEDIMSIVEEHVKSKLFKSDDLPELKQDYDDVKKYDPDAKNYTFKDSVKDAEAGKKDAKNDPDQKAFVKYDSVETIKDPEKYMSAKLKVDDEKKARREQMIANAKTNQGKYNPNSSEFKQNIKFIRQMGL